MYSFFHSAVNVFIYLFIIILSILFTEKPFNKTKGDGFFYLNVITEDWDSKETRI